MLSTMTTTVTLDRPALSTRSPRDLFASLLPGYFARGRYARTGDLSDSRDERVTYHARGLLPTDRRRMETARGDGDGERERGKLRGRSLAVDWRASAFPTPLITGRHTLPLSARATTLRPHSRITRAEHPSRSTLPAPPPVARTNSPFTLNNVDHSGAHARELRLISRVAAKNPISVLTNSAGAATRQCHSRCVLIAGGVRMCTPAGHL